LWILLQFNGLIKKPTPHLRMVRGMVQTVCKSIGVYPRQSQ
jgi:hypothetical protein